MPNLRPVLTVRLAPSLIAALRERADSRWLMLSATGAGAVQSYLGHERHGGKAR